MSAPLSFGGLVVSGTLRGGGAVSELSRGWTLEAETQDQQGGKPATLVKGPGLGSLSASCRVLRQLGGDPEGIAGQFGRLAELGQPDVVSFAGRVIGENRWLLREVSLTDVVFNGRGRMTAATIELQFEEFVAEATATAVSSGEAAPGLAGSSSIALTDTYGLGNDAQTKAALKRGADNPQTGAAV